VLNIGRDGDGRAFGHRVLRSGQRHQTLALDDVIDLRSGMPMQPQPPARPQHREAAGEAVSGSDVPTEQRPPGDPPADRIIPAIERLATIPSNDTGRHVHRVTSQTGAGCRRGRDAAGTFTVRNGGEGPRELFMIRLVD